MKHLLGNQGVRVLKTQGSNGSQSGLCVITIGVDHDR